MSFGVKTDDSIGFGVVDLIGEDGSAGFLVHGVADEAREILTVEDIVTEDEGSGVGADEVFADDEGLGEPIGGWLGGVLEIDSPLGAVAEESLERFLFVRGGDDEDVFDPREKEDAEGVVDHRFAINRDELLADAAGDGMKP